MEYSAVTQPLPVSRRNGGTFSSTLAVQSTQVSPHFISTLPAACFVKLRTILIGRSSLSFFMADSLRMRIRKNRDHSRGPLANHDFSHDQICDRCQYGGQNESARKEADHGLDTETFHRLPRPLHLPQL